MLEPGDPAPDFDLPGTDGEEMGIYRLSNALARGPVVLVFYPFDFHPRCTDDLCALRDFAWVDVEPDVTVFGVGPDSAYSHREYVDRHDVGFALLSDGDRYVADLYGVPLRTIDSHAGVPERAVFVVDTDATVRYARAAEGDEDPDLDAVVAALEGA